MLKSLTLLTTPFLLRRLVRAHEHIAQELTLIRQGFYYAHAIPGPVETPSAAPGDDADISYSSDADTWEREERDRRRVGPQPEE